MRPVIPGEIVRHDAAESIEINAGLPVTELEIENTGPWPVHLTAHFHVCEANRCLRFDRRRAVGMRLDVPVDGQVRFAPGERKRVALVPIGGARVVRGFNGALDGPLDSADPDAVLAALVARGFLHAPASDEEV